MSIANINVNDFLITVKLKKKYNKNFINFVKKIKIIITNVVSFVKLINQFRIYNKITIVTIIRRSSFLIIIVRIVFTIIKNINFAISINVSTT